MKMLATLVLLAAGLEPGAVALADHDNGRKCRTEMLAGRWLFATGIGHQQIGPPAPPPGRITAIGTMNIDRLGRLAGDFDVTFEAAGAASGVRYSGSAMLNADCTGTLSFVTENGITRTDSIALVERDLFWGMSQDPNNPWTYQARKIPNKHVRIDD